MSHTPGPWKVIDRPNALGTFTVFFGPHGPGVDNQIGSTKQIDDARLRTT